MFPERTRGLLGSCEVSGDKIVASSRQASETGSSIVTVLNAGPRCFRLDRSIAVSTGLRSLESNSSDAETEDVREPLLRFVEGRLEVELYLEDGKEDGGDDGDMRGSKGVVGILRSPATTEGNRPLPRNWREPAHRSRDLMQIQHSSTLFISCLGFHAPSQFSGDWCLIRPILTARHTRPETSMPVWCRSSASALSVETGDLVWSQFL